MLLKAAKCDGDIFLALPSSTDTAVVCLGSDRQDTDPWAYVHHEVGVRVAEVIGALLTCFCVPRVAEVVERTINFYYFVSIKSIYLL